MSDTVMREIPMKHGDPVRVMRCEKHRAIYMSFQSCDECAGRPRGKVADAGPSEPQYMVRGINA
jgi:hypothetical protein